MNISKAAHILKNTRLEKTYNLAEISQKTKIPLKYLEAIEAEDCQHYPAEPYCSLFVGKYADFLGLDRTKIVSLFRRDLGNLPQSNTFKKPPVYLTPQFLFTSLIVGLLLVMFSFLLGRYMSFNKPPSLTVNWPTDIGTGQVKISGTTDPNSTLRINEDLIIIDQDGNFSKLIDISQEPLVKVEATSPYGQKNSQEHNFNL